MIGVYRANMQNEPYPSMSPSTKVLGGFPMRHRQTLKYVDTVSLDPGAGSIATAVFSGRNLFDPDTAIGGHQPSNYDLWTTIYDRWTVINTKVKVSPAPTGIAVQQPGFWGFLVSRSGVAVASLTLAGLLEQPYVKYSDFPSSAYSVVPNIAGAVTASLPSIGWMGLDEEKQLLDETYSWTDSAGMLSAVDFFIEVFYSHVGGNDPGAQIFKVELEYDCIFMQPKITRPS